MPDVLVTASQKQQTSWDVHTQQSLEFTENVQLTREQQVCGQTHLVYETGQMRMS